MDSIRPRSLSPPDRATPASLYRALLPRVGALVGAIALLSLLALRWLGASVRDTLTIAAFMLFSGGVSIAVGWLTLRYTSLRHVGLRRTIMVIGALGPLFMILNIAFTARLMFISTHDLRLLILLLLFAIIPGLAVASLLSERIDRAVAELNAGAIRMATGDLSTRVRSAGIAELRSLAASFNSMATRLETLAEVRDEAEQARRDLIAAVSHDLRTPLASLRALAEALHDGVVDDPEGVQRYLGLMVTETERLSGLIDDLFELARIESGTLRLDLAPLMVQDLLSEALERMSAQAALHDLRLGGSVEGDPPPVLIDSQQITRALLNLVQNAIQHTPRGGEIWIGARHESDTVTIDVRDTGDGIAAGDLPRIFERFYRGDPARSRDAGAGLGLAIARGIIEAHGGTIRAESAPGGGTRIHFTLPLAP
jgi:two-component system sensor histidine kinase BaeS